ncbi:MAG: glycosyltransferase [Candidatus Pacebacteria bacterium]|nr:glycosyltransferase [Candidatus Paceibacterota bacterium]
MHIVYVSQFYPPHKGGIEQVAVKQAQSAFAAGHRVSVVTCALDRASVGEVDESGVTVYRVAASNVLDRRFGLPFSFVGFSMLRTLARVVREAHVVHIHDVFYMPSWFAYLVARYYHKDIVLTQHVAMVEHPRAFVRAVEQIVYRTWGRALFRSARAIVAYNIIVRDFLIRNGVSSKKILQVRNGISVRDFTPARAEERRAARTKLGLPQDRILVLFVGRMVAKKGYRELFEARDPSYDIVFVGPGSVPDSWRSTPNVHVLGPKKHEDLPEIYRAADIFCAPSRGELFTLVMQEAFACGLPVVATNEPEYAEYQLDTERIALVEPVPALLRRVLVRLAAEPDVRARMGTYSRELAEVWFEWDNNVSSVLDLYERCRATRVQVTTSWDDGHILDTCVAQLLDEYGMTGTFYVAPDNVEFSPDVRLDTEGIRSLARRHEVGAHTLTHRHLTTLSDDEAYKEIAEGKRVLEDILGTPVSSFCYPAGRYVSKHADMARVAGYTLARTVKRFRSRVDDPYQAHTTLHTYDHWLDVWGVFKLSRGNPLTFFTLYRRWDRQAMHLFDRTLSYGGVFHLWGHSWEIAENKDWERLRSVLQYIHGRTDVAYVQNRDLA